MEDGGPRATPLVGRADELAALLATCDGAAGDVTLVTGVAGIGKTRLLDEVAARLTASDVPVLRGHAVAGGGPFRPLAQALVRAAPPALAADPRLEPHRAVLARLLPGWPAPGPEVPYLVDPVVVLAEAVRELLRVVAAGGRLAVLLDDMHWADPDTLAVLEYLGDGLADLPVHVVLAARDDEDAPAGLAALARTARRTPLLRLDDEHVGVLARRCGDGAVAEEVQEFLVAAVDGLPFLVEELFAGLVESGRIARDALGWHATGPLAPRVPGAFARVVARRVAALPQPALVHTAAVLGGEVDGELLVRATGLGETAVHEGLRTAVAQHLLVTGDGGVLRWRHALTRDAVLADLTAPERSALALRAAEALVADAPHGDRLALAADLLVRGGEPLRAVELLLALARETTAAGALVAAEAVLSTAAELAAGHPGPVGEVAVEQVRVLALGARTDDAVARGDAVLPTLPAAAGQRLAEQLARACVAAERWARARGYLDLTGSGPAALALAAHVALGVDDRDEALRLAAAAVAAGEEAGAHEAVCEALEVTGRALRRSDPAASAGAFGRAERRAAAHGLVPWRVRALAELGVHDIFGTRGTARLEEARRLAQEVGLLGTATSLDLQIAAATMSRAGQVAALPFARRCAEQGARLRLPAPRAHALLFVARGLFWAAEDGADACLDEAERIAPNPAHVQAARDGLRAYAAWLDHDDTAAAAGLGVAVARLRSPVSNPAPAWGNWVLVATVAHPDDDGPRAELRGSDLLVQVANVAALRYADAVAAHRGGDERRARRLLGEGHELVAGQEYVRLFLRCLLVPAVVPGGVAAGLADPEPWLREGLARWEPAGEVRLTRWCRERLRMLGVAVPRPGRDRTAMPARLRALGVTGRELEVLRLVAGGASNSEAAASLHLSPRTVETHVSNLLAKTGAAGRGALGAWL
ncbi:ATP-binding protein [Pseudonocardia saturnea]